MFHNLNDASSFIVAGHRGFKTCYPENTLLAFREALKLGVAMLEFDLRMSKDDVVIVLHDETVDRTTNGTGPVNSFTLTELKQLDAGGWFGKEFQGIQIPTLEELCEMLKEYPDLLLNVEIKPSEQSREVADQAIAMLKAYDFLPRCTFTCFDAAILGYLHDEYQLKTQGFEEEALSNFETGEQGTYSKMWAIALPMRSLTKEKVQVYQAQGLHVWCYCPDTEEQVAYALACGSTLLTSNDPRPALNLQQQLTLLASNK